MFTAKWSIALIQTATSCEETPRNTFLYTPCNNLARIDDDIRDIFVRIRHYTDDAIQRWRTVRDTRASKKDLVLGLMIDALKHNKASKVIII